MHPDMNQVLYRIWSGQVTTKSDIAREYADEIAEASSRGWITTLILRHPNNSYGRQWRMTPVGLSHLFAHLAPEEIKLNEFPEDAPQEGRP